MKIVHVVEPLATGINTFILQLTHNMVDHEHIILHGVRSGSRNIESIKFEYPSNVRFVFWEHAQREISLIKDVRAYRAMFSLLKRENPDVIHLHSTKAGILGRIAGFQLRKKNIIYTPNAASFLRKDIGSAKRHFYQWIEKIANALSGQVVASSSGEFEAFEQIGINCSLIQNGAKVPAFQSEKKITDKITVVNCGLVSVQKNPKMFNEIALSFVSNPHVEFVWIGSGNIYNELNSPNITVTGWKNKGQVFEYLKNARIYLSTSLWEGLPLAGVEALGSGLAMVLHACPGNEDLVEDKQNGYIFRSVKEARELLEGLLRDQSTLSNLGAKSIELYESKFTDVKCSKQYLAKYNEILSS